MNQQATTIKLEPSDFLDELECEHREWLSNFDGRYLTRFANVKSGNYEAAMTEAAVRRLLQQHGVNVEPNEDLDGSSQQPDFACTKSGAKFFVEVTCISIDKVVEETHLPYPTESGARHYSMLNDSFWSACKGKAKQCSGLDHPTLVAVGTFHTAASVLCVSKPHVDMLLTGETKIAWNIDVRTGGPVGDTFLQTELYSAAFLRPDRTERPC